MPNTQEGGGIQPDDVEPKEDNDEGGPSQVIDPPIYKVIADLYGDARNFLLEANSYLFEAVYQVVLLNEMNQEIDLLSPFYNAYQVISSQYATPMSFVPAVRALNLHILRRSGYINISSYLTYEGITVTPSWQVLSETAGYRINDDLVEG